jgi:magnesium-transporting ATPase (P-type)
MEYNILKDNITITIIIIMCIIFVSTIYIVFGIFVNYELDEYMYDDKHKYFDEEYVKNTSMYTLMFNISFTLSLLLIIAFFIKSMFDIVVAPNIDILKYKNIYEMYTGSSLIIILVTFSQVLNKQYKDIKMKLSGRIY